MGKPSNNMGQKPEICLMQGLEYLLFSERKKLTVGTMFQSDISIPNVFVFSNYNIVLKNDASAACTYKY